MSKLSQQHRNELANLLSTPARYRELKPVIEAYMPKTPYRRLASFEEVLVREKLLHRLEVTTGTRSVTALYASGAPTDWDAYQVARALCPNGYFCNLTSLFYHTLTNQVPSAIYLAVESIREKDQRGRKPPALSDAAIFEAFIQPHRVSRHKCRFQKHEIVITERVGRMGAGVEEVRKANRICPRGTRITGLERALIDAVVHPQYNGGLMTVVEVFRTGVPQVDPQRLREVYDQLAFRYPYWQAIGFLLDRVGASSVAAAFSRNLSPMNKFYLDHGAKTSWAYNQAWKIFYPKDVL